ncbi:MAG: Sec-independent protein translocase protein TatB [Pseudomonadota bacterium]
MLDLGWSELLVIAAVALIVVGPKELPGMLRTIGKFMRVIRQQANEFRNQFDEVIKDTEFEDVRKEFQELRSDVNSTIRGATSDIENEFRELDQIGRDTERQLKNGGSNGTAETTSAASIPHQKAETQSEADTGWMDQHNKAILAREENNRNRSAPEGKIKDTVAGAHTAQAAEEKIEVKRPVDEGAGKTGAAT